MQIENRKTLPVVVARDPFVGKTETVFVKPGQTLAEIVDCVPGLPAGFHESGAVSINDNVIYPDQWHRVRPFAVAHSGTEIVVTLRFHIGKRAKNIIKTVALIAVLAAANAVTGGALGPLTGGFLAGGSLAASLAGAAVGLAGYLAVAAFSKPPKQPGLGEGDTNENRVAGAQGNQLIGPGSTIARVIGTRTIYPQGIVRPLVELDGRDEVVEIIYALAGPHKLDDIRIDGAPVSESADISVETREGWQTDLPVSLVSRYSYPTSTAVELSRYKMTDGSNNKLEDQSTPENSLPKWHVVTSRKNADEIWLTLNFPEGVLQVAHPDNPTFIPLRLRMRKKGDTAWINLPELQFAFTDHKPTKYQIKLKFKSGTKVAPNTSRANGLFNAWHTVPDQSTYSPAIGAWAAHTSFDGGGADNDVDNLAWDAGSVTLYLDHADFDQNATWEIGARRGFLGGLSGRPITTYQYGSEVVSLFDYYIFGSDYMVRGEVTETADTVRIERVDNIYSDTPVKTKGLAQIAIKARNRVVGRLSVKASGYVRDWDGSDWTNWITTSNPAPHAVDILIGNENRDALPRDLINNADFTAWRTWCDTMNYKCDAVFDNTAVQSALDLVMSCGRAKPIRSDQWGVQPDQYRGDEAPVQVFAPNNMNNFQYRYAFVDVPDALLLRYTDADNDDKQVEELVGHPDKVLTSYAKQEIFQVDGVINRSQAVEFAENSFRQMESRKGFYTFDTDFEALACRKGSLIGVNHPVINSFVGFGSIVSVETDNGGNIRAIVLDTVTDLGTDGFFTGDDFFIGSDFFTVKMYGAAIRLATGAIVTHHVTITGAGTASEKIEFVGDLPTGITLRAGLQVQLGVLGMEYDRFLVTEINWKNDLTAQIVCVDEAPEIHVNENPNGIPFNDGSFFNDGAGWAE